MKSELISTGVILRELQCFNIDTLKDRILLQKKVFLLQQLGVNLGFSYSWYLHGPYSKELTSLAYQCVPMGMESFSSYQLKSEIEKKVIQVNNLINNLNFDNYLLGISDWYELVASIVYSLNQDNTQENAIDEVLALKPWFNREEAEQAIAVWSKINGNRG